MSRVTIRSATPEDAPLLHTLVGELAAYEKLSAELTGSVEMLRSALFAPTPVAEALVGELEGTPVGFALFFTTFSTFLMKPGIHLEDLYVREAARGHGVGRALLQAVAQRAEARGCGRLEWDVLDWNAPSIAFYESLGAQAHRGWTPYRVTGARLTALARADRTR